MFRRLLMTISRDMPNDARFGYQFNFPLRNQLKEFNGQIPDDWHTPIGPIVLGNFSYGGPVIPPIPPPPPPPEAEST